MGRPKVAMNQTTKGKKRKLDKDPNKPKRATTAYFYFLAAERELAKSEGRETNKIAEFTKAVSAKWRALTDVEKKVFEDKAIKDRERYQSQMAIYTGKDPSKPKRPQSAYFNFLAKFRAENKDKYEHKEILKKAGEEWNNLTAEQKKPFEAKAEEDRKKYEIAMKEYGSGNSPTKKPKVEANNGATAAEEEDEEEDDDDFESEEED